MPKLIFLSVLAALLVMPYGGGAMAAGLCAACSVADNNKQDVNKPTYCESYSTSCKTVGGTCYCGYTCNICESGYVLGPTYSFSIDVGCDVSYRGCEGGGGGTTTPTCYTSNGSTTGNGTGCVSYSKGTTTAIRCDSCNTGYTATESYLEMCDGSTSKRYSCVQRPSLVDMCEQNQYKRNNLDGTTTCVDCPDGGTTWSPGGGTAITDCYLPAGTAFTDTAGSGTYTSDCYYTRFSL